VNNLLKIFCHSISKYTTCLAILLIFTATKNKAGMHGFRLLSLGDSYTIGEQVAEEENFPNQTVNLLRKSGYNFETAEIIATTGWTTDELQKAIDEHQFSPPYDFITLLIGVNNQYRGRSVENYRIQFDSLLQQAIKFAGGRPNHVIVLSIPDWGVTPYAADRDRKSIAKEIDEYNEANNQIATSCGAKYIDITTLTREAANNSSLLAPDGLHPSGKDYARWAEKVAKLIERRIK
jgi:lysophospholipase L1-like esterase